MSDVVKFYPKDAANDPDNVLEQAIGVYQDVLVIGYDKDGNLDARSSNSLADRAEIIWLIEAFKFNLMKGHYNAEMQND